MAVRKPVLVEFQLKTGLTTYINVRSDIVEYFNITPAVLSEAQALVLKERQAHTRNVRKSLNVAATETTVGKAQWYGAKYEAPEVGGIYKKILVPTELLNGGGNIVMTTIRVPSIAINGQIAIWINTKFIAHKPGYFLTPSGKRHPVNVTAPADPNPGQPESPATP